MEKMFYNVEETAEILGVSKVTVARWVKAGTLKSAKIGGRRLIPGAVIEEIVKKTLG